MRDIRKKSFTQIYETLLVWRGHVGVTLRSTNMAAENQEKHSSLSFPKNA